MGTNIVALHYDIWSNDGATSNGIDLRFPSIKVVKEKISALDQVKFTIVGLKANDGSLFVVGGGLNQLIAYVEFTELESINLCSAPDDNSGAVVSVSVGGQEGIYPACQVISFDLALQAATYFYKVGRPDPSLIWVKNGVNS